MGERKRLLLFPSLFLVQLILLLTQNINAQPLTNPAFITRSGVLQESESTSSNCHEATLTDAVQTEPIIARKIFLKKQSLLNDDPSTTTSNKGKASFCYYSSYFDSLFELAGSPHRPALSSPSNLINANSSSPAYGNNQVFFSHDCAYFGSSQSPKFLDSQGWILNAVPSKPFFTMSGSFRAGINSRPVSEDQVVNWKILHSKSGDVDAAVTLQSGSFEINRKSKDEMQGVLNGGKYEIEPIKIYGLESGWIGIWYQIAYVTSLDPSDTGVQGKNLHLQLFNNTDIISFWNKTGEILIVGGNDPAWVMTPSPLGNRAVVLSNDGSSISQTLTGGHINDRVEVGWSCASRAGRPQVPIQISVNKKVIAKQICPAEFKRFTAVFEVTNPNNTVLSFSNNQGGSAQKCSELIKIGWKQPNPAAPCFTTPSLTCSVVQSQTFAQSLSLCTARGGRLCTSDELKNGAGWTSGCSDSTKVWSSDKCGSGQARAFAVTKTSSGDMQTECLSKMDLAMARCCADTDLNVDAAVIVADISLKTLVVEEQTNGLVSVCDDNIVMSFSEPSNPNLYQARLDRAKSLSTTSNNKQTTTSSNTNTNTTSSSSPAILAPSANPVLVYNFGTSTFMNQVVNGKKLNISDIGSTCTSPNNNSFVTSMIFGRQQTVFRFHRGTGLQINEINSVLNTTKETLAYTVAAMVSFERTDCFVRLLNLRPGEDNGLYLCDGIQMTPDRPVGRPLNPMEWYHIAISTNKDRKTKLYLNGKLLYSWTPTNFAWKSLTFAANEMDFFNDCGGQCNCNAEESSGGWISSLHVWNRVTTDQEIELLYDSIAASSGMLASYDLTTSSLDSVFDGADANDLLDRGLACSRPSTFVLDETLMGTIGNTVLSVPSGGGLAITGVNHLMTGSDGSYTLLIKFKVTERISCMSWLVGLGGKRGVQVCDYLVTNLVKRPRVGTGKIRINTWQTLVISYSSSTGSRIYLDGVLDHRIDNADLKLNLTSSVTLFSSNPLESDSNAVLDCSTNPSTSIPARVSSISLWKRALTYGEIIFALSKLGSEVKYTLDSSFIGNGIFPVTSIAPANSVCTFPFTYNGVLIDDCNINSPFCQVTSDLQQVRYGYCAPGSGYHLVRSMTIPTGSLGNCRGGVIRCQRQCSAQFACVGFTISKCASHSSTHLPYTSIAAWTAVGSTTISRTSQSIIIRAQNSDINNGARHHNIAVTVGQSYTLYLTHKPSSLAGSPFISIEDATGIVSSTGDTTFSSNKETIRVQFTARAASVTIVIKFMNPIRGHAVEFTKIVMPSSLCVNQFGEIISGVLLGQYLGLQASADQDIYRKVTDAPLMDIDANTNTLDNQIQILPALTSSLLTNTTTPSTYDISQKCPTTSKSCFLQSDLLGGQLVRAPFAAKTTKTCAQLSWPSPSFWPFTTPVSCGQTDSGNCQGSSSLTFDQAQQFCSSRGARLCTVAEIDARVSTGTGCTFDNGRVWTSTPCKCGSTDQCSVCNCPNCAITTAGNPDSLGSIPRACTSRTSTAAVRCCSNPTNNEIDASGGCSYEVSVSYDGYDIRAVEHTTIGECCSLCFAEPLCNSWSFARFESICYLKRNDVARRSDSNFISGVTRAATVQGYLVESSVDYPGNDMRSYTATVDKCIADCTATQLCTGVLWTPNTCWLKNELRFSNRRGLSLFAFRRSGFRYFRIVQASPTRSGSTWKVLRLSLFSSYNLNSPINNFTAIASSSASGFPASNMIRINSNSWQSTTGEGSWIGADFSFYTPYPSVRSFWIRSLNSVDVPTIIRIQESYDFETWRTVMTVRNFTGDYWANVHGIGGGMGGEVQNVFSIGKGSGIGFRNLDQILLTQDQTVYTILMRYYLGGVEEEPERKMRLVNTGNGDDGVYEQVSGMNLNPLVTRGLVSSRRWRSAAITLSNPAKQIRIVMNGETSTRAETTVILDDVFTTSTSWSQQLQIGAGGTLRLFSDTSLNAQNDFQCASSLSEDSSPLVSRVLLYGRELSTTEASNILLSMEPNCIHPTCNGNGVCIDGVCVCNRNATGGWKGDACDIMACPGVPECENRGTCRSDGTCACEPAFKGTSCESIKCPGAIECTSPTYGTCQDTTGLCICQNGFHGSDCSKKSCPGESINTAGERIYCSGHGSCDTSLTSPTSGQCTCSGTFKGFACSST